MGKPSLTNRQLERAVRSSPNATKALLALMERHGHERVLVAWFQSAMIADTNCIQALSLHLEDIRRAIEEFLKSACLVLQIEETAIERTTVAMLGARLASSVVWQFFESIELPANVTRDQLRAAFDRFKRSGF